MSLHEPPQNAPRPLALVITGLEPGGAEKCLVQLALSVDRRHFSPHVYSLQPRPECAKAVLVERLEAAGVPLHFLNATSSWSFVRVIWQLRRMLKRQSAEVVQTFLYHANVTGVLAARLAGIRWVFTGLRVADPNPYRAAVERWVYRLAALNVCVSRSVAQHYERSGFTAIDHEPSQIQDPRDQLWRRRLHVIPNGVSIAAYESALPADLSEEGIPAETPVILVVGRLHRQKGTDWLAHFLPELLGRLPEHYLVIAGDGPLRDSLVRKAIAHGVADRVALLGWRADVPQLLKRAALVLVPSRYEGMPNVLLESLAAGVPVVTTQVEGVAELLGESLTDACAVEFGHNKEWIEKYMGIATDPTMRRELIALGRERINAFSAEQMVGSYEQCWSLATLVDSAPAAYRESTSRRPDTRAPEADST